MIKFDEREALRYMGASNQDGTSRQLCQEVYFVLQKEMQPRHIVLRRSCQVLEEGVIIEGVHFGSRNLARHLQGCREVLLLAATLGQRTDQVLKRLALQSLSLGNAGQGVAAAMIEEYCNSILQNYRTAPLLQRPRFSPGYGDWDLEEQKKFFALVNCGRIGLTLTASGMMAPVKSVTAVVGLACVGEQKLVQGCAGCGLQQCVYRKMEK